MFIFICFFAVICFAQTNLVPNPSFEDTVTCPKNTAGFQYVQNWKNPTLGSPDYYNACNSSLDGVPINDAGFQNAYAGNAYAGFGPFGKFTWPSDSFREYIQVQLDSTFIKDEIYCITYYVSLAEKWSDYAVNNIGSYFSSLAISSSNYDPLPYIPQVVNPLTNQLTDTINWMKISGQFIASGGERYITIGNFNGNSTSDTVFIHKTKYPDKSSYYYIDDVSVIHLNAGAGAAQAVCNGVGVQLGRPIMPGLTYNWQPAAGLNDATIAQPIATPTVTTTYYLTATLTSSGCSKTDSVTITVVNANAGNDTLLCKGSNVTLGTQSLKGVSYNWQPVTGLNNPTIAQPAVTPASTTTYTVTASANSCIQTDSVKITVANNPIVTTSVNNSILCKGQTGVVTAIVTAGLVPYTYSWSNGASTSSATVSGLMAGSYAVRITDANNCKGTGSVTLPEPDAITTDVTIRNATCGANNGNASIAAAGGTGGYSYVWNNGTITAVTSGLSVGTYTITVFDVNGCTKTETLTISENPICLCNEEVFIANIFSPNNDGKNDVLAIEGNGLTNIYWGIYDRWGNLVFEAYDQMHSWDGTKKGSPVEAGVYVYYLRATCSKTNSVVSLKGNVSIVK